MRVLEQLEPQGVFRFFEELCAIPHGSRNCQAVSDWCVAFARERGLEHYQDQAGNVIIIHQDYVKKHTAPYKYPRVVVFRDSLPKTVSGKIIRNKL